MQRQNCSHFGNILVYDRSQLPGISGRDMRVIARRILREFWNENPDAEQPLKAWFAEAEHADWKTPQDIKDMYGSASVIGDNRVVFNIAGNKYRLVVHFHYAGGIARIRFIGSHAEYDTIDAEKV